MLPSHLGHSLHGVEKRIAIRTKIDEGFEWIKENLLGKSIDLAVRWRYLWIGTVLAMFLAAIALPAGGILKFQALLELDGDFAVARVLMSQGTSLEQLRGATLDLKSWMGRFDGVENLTTDLRRRKRKYRIKFRPGVLGVDLDSAGMASQLRAAFQGEQAAEIQVGSEAYEIEARFNRESQIRLLT